MCGGSYHDQEYVFEMPAPKAADKDDRIKKTIPKDQPISQSVVRSDGKLQMQPQRKPQFA